MLREVVTIYLGPMWSRLTFFQMNRAKSVLRMIGINKVTYSKGEAIPVRLQIIVESKYTCLTG